MLTHGGKFLTNGITVSYLSLLAEIDRERFAPICVVERDAVRGFTDRLLLLRRVPGDVRVLGRVGRMNVTSDEQRVIDDFLAHGQFTSEPMRQCYLGAFRREALRLFGYARVDRVVSFDGYRPYSSSCATTSL